MRTVNKVILIGNLTRDPELHQSEGKKSMCAFGLATNRNWTTDTGEKREETDFHNIVAFGKLGELCNEYLRKGRKVYLEGRLRSRSFTDNEGVERVVTEIVLDDMVILDSKFVKEAQMPDKETAAA